MDWKTDHRPGYLGRQRDKKHNEWDFRYRPGHWRLRWIVGPTVEWELDKAAQAFDYLGACKTHYEESYFIHLSAHPEEVDFICSYGECIDNAPTNVASGLDYAKQEAFSTHIQDIAVRNCLKRLGRWFEGPSDKILVIRSADSEGFKWNPGQIEFHSPELIITPSKCPGWAKFGSVEDFWQSNKVLQVLR